eukprot:PITA_22551
MFLKSVYASDKAKDGQLLFQLLDEVVEEVGVANVVQVITDNASKYVLAGKLLEEKHRTIFWTPCAAHCIDLMLEDICKLDWVKNTVDHAESITKFIYHHSWILSLMRRHAGEWNQSQWSHKQEGKELKKKVNEEIFWRKATEVVKLAEPLVKVLTLVDGEILAMGFIYEAMDQAKEQIKRAYKDKVAKYGPIWAIVDERWNNQLHCPIHADEYFLNPRYHYKALAEL